MAFHLGADPLWPGYRDRKVLDVKEQVKHRANAAYWWMSANPATAILVSAGVSAALTIALFLGLGLYSQSTFVAKTACSQDPSSAECAELRQAIARAEPIKGPCISYQRVTDQRGKNCPQQFVDQEKNRVRLRVGADQGPKGDASQLGPNGSQQVGPRTEGGGEDVAAGKGGEGSPATPGKGGSGQPSTPTDTGSNPAPAAAPTTAAPSTPSPSKGDGPPITVPPVVPPPVAKADVQVEAPGANLPDLDVCVQVVAGVCVRTR